jgi:hypothetical protein
MINYVRIILQKLWLIFLLYLLIGCARIEQSGYIFDDSYENYNFIIDNHYTKNELIALFGTPNFSINNKLYYNSIRQTRIAFFTPKILVYKTLEIELANNDSLMAIKTITDYGIFKSAKFPKVLLLQPK